MKCEEERRRDAEISELQRQFQLFVEAQKTKITNDVSHIQQNSIPQTVAHFPVDNKLSISSNSPVASWNSSAQNLVPNMAQAIGLTQKLGDEILIPSRPDPSDVKFLAEQTTGKTKVNAIDLKDFEREQDPFENVSLKVINDIEELDKVFFATNQLSQSTLQTTNPGHAFYREVPGLSNASVMNSAVASNIQTTSNSQMTTEMQNVAQWWGGPRAYLPGYIPQAQLRPGVTGEIFYPQHHYQMSSNTSNKNSTAEFNRHPMESSQNVNTHQNSIPIAQNFYYNKYHASTVNAPSAVTASSEQPLQSNLRHAKSTPDMAASDVEVENSETQKHLPSGASSYLVQNLNLYRRYTPPLHHEKAITRVILDSNSDTTSKANLPFHHHHNHNHQLPPPTNQKLNRDIQLIETLNKVGFERELIEKFVARFGADESNVTSRLRCIQDFISKGHDPRVTEECFLYIDSIPEQADKYLRVFGIFHVMGFPAENIHNALKISELNEELTLNILTQQ